MAKSTPKKGDEKIVKMETPEGGKPEKPATLEQKVDAIMAQAVSNQAFTQAMNYLGSEMDKFRLRIEALEAKTTSYEELADTIVSRTVDAFREEMNVESE